MSRHRGTTTSDRLSALEAALATLEEVDSLEPDDAGRAALATARTVLARARERRALSVDHTLAAFAGATGAGKSSLTNAVLGESRVEVGARRPTTGHAVAAVLGPAEGAWPLLDRAGVAERHHLPGHPAAGLVLLDLPDLDSVASGHRSAVDRLVGLVDALVWVVDPEKYADDLLHSAYLRPLATHAAVTFVVLNRADVLGPDELRAVVSDLRRLLAADGLPEVPVLVTSTRTGEGIAELTAALGRLAAERRAAEQRLAADARSAALGLAATLGSPGPAGVRGRDSEELAGVLAEQAGVDVVARAAARSYRLHARRHVGWPPTRWLGRLGPDPLRRLGLDRPVADPEMVRSSLPRPTAVQRSRVSSAVHRLGAAAAAGAREPWRGAIRAAAAARVPGLADALDQAVISTRLDSLRDPGWWRAFGALQWLALAAASAGGLWLGSLAGLAYLGLPEPETPLAGPLPWPTALAAGGVALGLLLALLGGLLARAGARRRARKVRRRLTDAVGRVAQEQVIGPVGAVVGAAVAFGGHVGSAATD